MEGEEKGKGEEGEGGGRVGPPQVKAWPPITIFLAPVLACRHFILTKNQHCCLQDVPIVCIFGQL